MDGYASKDRHGPRRLLLLLVTVGLFGLSGASCPQRRPEPRILPVGASLDQIIHVVNQNNGKIQTLSSTQATLSGKNFPPLRANLAFERPRKLRLRADLMGSPQLDFGSNESRFWFWVKQSQPPHLYFCAHDQFATSSARQAVPIDPEWLIEALGVVEIDPNEINDGPIPQGGERLAIQTTRQTPQGPAIRSLTIDGRYGWVLEQNLYDVQGRLTAKAVAGNHRRDPLSGLFVPGSVRLEFPTSSPPMTMRLDLGRLEVNRPLAGDPAQLWSMPCYQGAPAVDLCQPGIAPTAPVTVSTTLGPSGWRPSTTRR